MDVIIKLNTDQVFAINDLLEKINHLPFYSFNEDQKIAISIGVLLSDKFQKRIITLNRKKNKPKKQKMSRFTFRYHEAWALKNICINQISWCDSSFQKFVVQGVINELDKEK